MFVLSMNIDSQRLLFLVYSITGILFEQFLYTLATKQILRTYLADPFACDVVMQFV